MHWRRTTTASRIALVAVSIAPWLLLLACETPPSKYIPPTEPREVPNLDPPPGIPIMPSGSAAKARPSDGGGAGTVLVSPEITVPTCKTDRDCVVTAQTGCCDMADPRAELRSELDKMKASCKTSDCVDAGDAKPEPKTIADYFARCVKKSCTLVPKKKKGK